MARFALFARGISVLIYIQLDAAASEMISFWPPNVSRTSQLMAIKIVMTPRAEECREKDLTK